MSASLSDILTAAKNIVTAINSAAQTYLNVNGTSSQTAITSTTLIRTGQGRLVTVVVVTAGSAAGAIYDVSSITLTTNQIATIPTTVGIYVFNIPYNNGLVIAPGSGQKITISYS
jgi:hypothetical protein